MCAMSNDKSYTPQVRNYVLCSSTLCCINWYGTHQTHTHTHKLSSFGCVGEGSAGVRWSEYISRFLSHIFLHWNGFISFVCADTLHSFFFLGAIRRTQWDRCERIAVLSLCCASRREKISSSITIFHWQVEMNPNGNDICVGWFAAAVASNFRAINLSHFNNGETMRRSPARVFVEISEIRYNSNWNLIQSLVPNRCTPYALPSIHHEYEMHSAPNLLCRICALPRNETVFAI